MNRKFLTSVLLATIATALPVQQAMAQKAAGRPAHALGATRSRALADAAAPDSICTPRGYSFNFFNGVLTTTGGAGIAREEEERAYGTTAPNGENIKYEVFYNHTTGYQDFLETFSQRLGEQEQGVSDRFELFWEAIRGGGSWTSRISSVVGSYAEFSDAFDQYLQSAVIGSVSQLFSASPTISDYANHRTRLDAQILEGKKIILFAHSQGNLFANAAYDYAAPKIGSSSIAAVHVAPASPSVRGEWTLADLDLVINGLRTVGSVPAITTSIPGYLLRPAGLNGEKDWLGHGLLEIYMNPALATSGRIKGHVQAALAGLATPEQEGQTGFFTATLTWNGSGDVDLHSFEPGGSHVYYLNLQGNAGYLDVDNVIANGPEHYYASCDPEKLEVGTYRIGVNNYSQADGKTAFVQISSKDGVLASRSTVLGASRGNAGNGSPTLLLSVVVSKDPDTGEYHVSAN